MEIRLETSRTLSWLYAAWAVAHGRTLVSAGAQEAIEQPARQLDTALSAAAPRGTDCYRHLLPLAAENLGRAELARRVLVKVGVKTPAGPSVGRIVAALAAVEVAFTKAVPKLDEELALRRQPIADQFEARGHGLLAGIRRRVDEDFIADRPQVYLVYPVLGGGGASHWLYNRVHCEAVLADPLANLPEVVRLGWLISQLQLELPRYSEGFGRDRLAIVGPLATIPLALAAAEDVELARCDAATIQTALSNWTPDESGRDDRAELLLRWWQTYSETRPAWSTALAALERLLR